MMKQFLIFFSIAIIALLFACNNSSTDAEQKRVAKGDYNYGGNLKIAVPEAYHTLNPYNIIDVVSSKIASQIYEGLVRYDMKNLKVKPAIAESWTISDDGTIYTFKIKQNIQYQEDECFENPRIINANDVKYAFTQACTYTKYNNVFENIFKGKLKGADKYYEASKNGTPEFEIEGIKVIDDFTIELTLNNPYPSFLDVLALPGACIVVKEAYEKYQEKITIGSGPFIFVSSNENQVILARNKNYHGTDSLGNQLPYLDTIIISYIDTKQKEVQMFLKKELDIVAGLNNKTTKDILQDHIKDFQSKKPKYILERSADMECYYLALNTQSEILKDKNVRLALASGIDKFAVVKNILKAEDSTSTGINGITPKLAFKQYDTLYSTSFDIEKAKEYLKASGKEIKKLDLLINNRDKENIFIAKELQYQLRVNLGIELNWVSVPLSKQIEAAKLGKFDLLLSSWTADFPSPETFLWLTYGANVPESMEEPSYPNFSRYSNSDFDALYQEAIQATNTQHSLTKFAEAESIMLQDAPIVPIWYPESFRMRQANIKGFYFNPLKYMDLSKVYFEKEKQAEVQPKEHKE